MNTILEIKNLKVVFNIEGRNLTAVDGIDLKVYQGKTLGIVGESGCGKSVTANSILRLIPNPPGKIVNGEILYAGKDLLKLPIQEMYKIRGKEISMIFQEPMTALNPVLSVYEQLAEVYELHFNFSKNEIKEHCIKMLDKVGIPNPEIRLKDYPHQLSGGMRQRVMIAMALACSPKILIADEPTTALDVTIQAQILDLINKLKTEFNTSTIFITHDLGVVSTLCDFVNVMYAAKIVEATDTNSLFAHPLHPYTKGLLDSIPKKNMDKNTILSTIEGMVPDLFKVQTGCRFADRCYKCKDICKNEEPILKEITQGHSVACHFPLENK